jgi:hypothetical protein
MSDLIYLGVIVGFFVVAFGLLRACERIIGPDTPVATTTGAPAVVDLSTDPEAATVTR